jgi:small subunit ribosomal protein S15
MLTKRQKQNVIKEHSKHESDTGSNEVQIGLLSKKIKLLADHLKKNQKDIHSRRGLLIMVGKRRRLLLALKLDDEKRYALIVKKLAIES